MIETVVDQITWQGVDAWLLENAYLRVVTIPQIGAKIASLLDKRTGREWLTAAGHRDLRPIPYGARFHEQDMSGWDEMFPTIATCSYPAQGDHHHALLPDHGEVWTMSWDVVQADDGGLTFAVKGKALPYCLARTLTFSAPDVLHLHYRLTNLGQSPMPYIWAAHPQLVCDPEAEIILPPEITVVCNTLPDTWGWGAPETAFGWPLAIDPAGAPFRMDRVGPSTLRRGRKVYALPDIHPTWIGIVSRPSGDWLHLDWDLADVPYLGLWVDEGALSRRSVVVPEPATGFYDSLELAWSKQEVMVVAPGATNAWTLRVRLGTGAQSSHDTPEPRVHVTH